MNSFEADQPRLPIDYVLVLYILTQVIQDIFTLLSSDNPFYKVKLSIDILILLIVLLYRCITLPQKHLLTITCKLLQLIDILLFPNIEQLIYILSLQKIIKYKQDVQPIYKYLDASISIVGSILAGAIISRDPIVLIILIGINLTSALEVLLNLKKGPTLQKLQNSVRSHQFFPGLRDDIWKQRLQVLPLTILLVNKQDLTITYTNRNLNGIFSDHTLTPGEAGNVVLMQIKFSIVSQQLNEQYSASQQVRQSFKSNIVQNSKKAPSSQSIDSKFISIEESRHKRIISYDLSESRNIAQTIFGQEFKPIEISMPLSQILQLYMNGMYQKFVDPVTKSLELSGTYTNCDGVVIQLACFIILNQTEDEIMIVLNDISKFNELQQRITKDDFKSKFIQSFSHEMRTPLNSAINFIECSINDNRIVEQIKLTCLQPALSSLHVQSYLINDIVDFSSYHQDQLQLQLRDISISWLVTEVSNIFRHQFDMKNLKFKIDLSQCEFTQICTDYERVMQVIVNLLQNAIKFSYYGQVLMKIKTTGQNVKVSIRDQGIGISASALYQIRNTMRLIVEKQDFSTYKEWHGFGLLICQIILTQIAPVHHKAILVKSSKDKGTVLQFMIYNYKASNPQLQKTIRCIHSIQSFNSNSDMLSVNNAEIPEFENQLNKKKHIAQERKSITSKRLSYFVDSTSFKLVAQMQVNKPKFIEQLNRNKKDESLKYVSIQSIQQMADHESEQQLNQFEQNQKCSCKRIMSVDDEIFNQKSIEILLKQLGFEVCLAFNGQEAIERIQKLEKCGSTCYLLNMILMDYQMPIINGIEATKLLKQMMFNSQIPQIPIVGLTAFTSQYDIDQCLSAGMCDVMSKPFKVKDFKEILSLI